MLAFSHFKLLLSVKLSILK